MGFNDIGEIRSAVNSFRNDDVWMRLRTRYEDDFDIYRLKPYDAGRGYFSYTSNFPRVFANKVVAMLVMAKLLIRIPDELLLDAEMQEIASNVERYLYGSFNLNDERNILIPQMPSIRAQKAWYACIRGGYATRTFVYKDEKGETVPDVKVWDIYNVAYGKDENGVSWAAHTRKATAEQLNSEYGLDLMGKAKPIDVIDYWDDKKYGVIVGDKWAKELTEHGLDHCPVHIFTVGECPPVWQESYNMTGIHVGESIFAANRNIIPIFNKTMSDIVTLVRRGVKVPLGYWSQTGDKTIDEDIWQVEKAATISLQTGEDIKPIMTQTMPADTAPMLNIVTGESQRGFLPYTAFGELGFRLSGFAISQLQGSLETVIQPPATCLERSYFVESRELLEQYAAGGFKAVAVRGRTSKNQPFGYPKADTIKPSGIEGDWHPEVSLVPVLPKDDAQRWSFANIAREGEVPLMSMKSIRGEILGMEDPDLEDDQIKFEWADNLIISRLYTAYQRALEDGQPDKAVNILAELRRLMMAQAPQGGGGKPTGGGGGMGRLEQAAAGTPGAGMPPGQTGMPPTTMPSEMMGGMPGGALNAQMPLFPPEV